MFGSVTAFHDHAHRSLSEGSLESGQLCNHLKTLYLSGLATASHR